MAGGRCDRWPCPVLSDGRWQVYAMELPRGRWSATEQFQNEEDARAVLDAFYGKHAAAGMWEVSRWGPKSASTQREPGW
jgi:hypothetical protein